MSISTSTTTNPRPQNTEYPLVRAPILRPTLTFLQMLMTLDTDGITLLDTLDR